MQEFIDIFSGLRRRYGFCNVQNAKIHPATGKKYFEKKDYGWSKTELKDGLKKTYQSFIKLNENL